MTATGMALVPTFQPPAAFQRNPGFSHLIHGNFSQMKPGFPVWARGVACWFPQWGRPHSGFIIPWHWLISCWNKGPVLVNAQSRSRILSFAPDSSPAWCLSIIYWMQASGAFSRYSTGSLRERGCPPLFGPSIRCRTSMIQIAREPLHAWLGVARCCSGFVCFLSVFSAKEEDQEFDRLPFNASGKNFGWRGAELAAHAGASAGQPGGDRSRSLGQRSRKIRRIAWGLRSTWRSEVCGSCSCFCLYLWCLLCQHNI